MTTRPSFPKRNIGFAVAVATLSLSSHALEITPDISTPVGKTFEIRVLSPLPEGSEVRWEQTEGPAWLLRGRKRSEAITLKAEWPGRYRFKCVARLPDGKTETAQVAAIVTPPILRPVAKISGPLTRLAGAGDTVFLSGEQSYDPAGRPLKYYWAQVSGPTARVKKGTGRKALLEFVPSEPGRYVFSLQVKAGRTVSEPAVTVVEVPARPGGGADHSPSLVISAPRYAAVGDSVRLDASASKDIDGDEVAISWEVLEQPPGGDLRGLSGNPVFEFTPTKAGRFRFRVRAKSGKLERSKEIVVLTVPGEHSKAATTPSSGNPETASGPISVEWKTETLEDALSELSRRFGLEIMPSPTWLPPSRFREIYLDLRLENAPEEILLTWLSRLLGGRYRKTAPGRYYIDNGYGFIRTEPEEAFSTVLGPSFQNLDDPAGWLESAVKPVVLALGRTELISMNGPFAGAVLPETAVKRLNSLITAATSVRPQEAGAPPPECPALGKTVEVQYSKALLRDVLWDLGKQAGVNIGFDCAKLPERGRTVVSVSLGKKPLREALSSVMKGTPLSVVNVDSPFCIWLSDKETPPPGPNLWDAAEVASFDLGPVLKKGRITPSLVIHLIQRRVRPATWKDPAAAALFLPRKNRLIVINHPWVITEVRRFLQQLRQLDFRYWSTGK